VRRYLWLLVLCSCEQQLRVQESSTSAPPSAAVAACGGKAQPDCPLQGWMKSTMQPYQHDKELGRLALAFDKLAQNAPAGYASWKEIANAGASAARNRDETAISKTCKSCHNEHRSKFRKERRNVPLF
jgi:hypothetical protein